MRWADEQLAQGNLRSRRQVLAHRYSALTSMPTIRPKVAPTAIDGTKMPAGTLQPYEMTTRRVRKTVARSRELTIRHCAQVLRRAQSSVSWGFDLDRAR